jgi:hypothetical protein
MGIAGDGGTNGKKNNAGSKYEFMDNAKLPTEVPGVTVPSSLEGQSSGKVEHARSGSANKVENMNNMPKNSGSKYFSGEGSSKIKYS